MTITLITPVEDYVRFVDDDSTMTEQALAWCEDISEETNKFITRRQEVTLTDAANIAWNLETSPRATVTLAGNRTLDNPSNLVAGVRYFLRVVQDGAGSRTLAYGTAYLFPGGTAPVLTTAANAVDILQFYSDGTNMYGNAFLNFS